MTADKAYLKQLEAFGIESTRVKPGDINKKQQEQYRLSMLAVVKMLMETMQGRQWIYSKLDMCKIFTTPFVPNDSHGTSFFAGIQAVGQNLLNDIMQACPEAFYTMISEESARKSGTERLESE